MDDNNDALENDPILQKLRETKSKKLARWFYNISRCLLNPDLLILQSFCVFLYGSFGAITPYLPLYFKKYNLAPYQVGVVLGVSPIVQCLVSPVWRTIATKWHAQKFIFLAAVMSFLVKLLLFLAVEPHKQFCFQVYTNSTSNITYTRFVVNKESTQDASVKWKVTKNDFTTKPAPNHFTTTSSPSHNITHDSSAFDGLLHDQNNLWSSSATHKTRHLLSSSPQILNSLSSSMVVIKKSSAWNSILHETVHYTLIGDNVEVYDIFLIFLLFTLVCDFLQAPTFGLGDGSVFNRLEDKFRSSPTKMHFTGSCGWAGTAMIVGAIIYGSNALHCGSFGFTYHVAFYFGIGFVCMAFTNALWFEYHYDTERQANLDIVKQSLGIFCRPKYLVFLLCFIYVSLCSGFLVPFLNWYIDDLGGTPLVVATASTTRVLIIFVFYQVAVTMAPILGKVNVLFLSLMCYAICFFCYWLIKHTWIIVAVVVLEGIGFAFVLRCCDDFISQINVSDDVSSIIKDVLSAMFWGIGQGIGTIIGGALYGWQRRNTFCALGIATVGVLVVIAGIICYLKHNERENQIEDNDKDRLKH